MKTCEHKNRNEAYCLDCGLRLYEPLTQSTKARRDELAEQIGMLTSKYKETAKHYFKFGWDSAQSLANEREKILREALESTKQFLEIAPLQSGVCCCGSQNCNPMIDGHSFVDSGGYAIESVIKNLDNALTAVEGSHD